MLHTVILAVALATTSVSPATTGLYDSPVTALADSPILHVAARAKSLDLTESSDNTDVLQKQPPFRAETPINTFIDLCATLQLSRTISTIEQQACDAIQRVITNNENSIIDQPKISVGRSQTLSP